MSIDLEALARETIPGRGPSDLAGKVIAVPVPATSAGVPIIGRDVFLMGWSFRESTGVGGVIAELYDGSSSSGVLLACIDLNNGQDPGAAQTPAAQSNSGGNAQQVASISPPAGQLAFLTGIQIYGLGATAALEVTATLTGLLGGNMSFPVQVPAGATVPITPVTQVFGGAGLQGSVAGQAIVLTVPAFGAGNTFEQASLQGYFRQPAGLSGTEWFGDDGIYVRSGLFLNPVAGSLKGAVYIRS